MKAISYSSSRTTRLRLETNVAINLVLLAAPFYGILINGYKYGTADQDFQIPEIIHLADPSCFPNDYLFDEPSGEYTLFLSAMAFLVRRFPLEVVCLVGHVVSHYLLCWAVYHISLNLFRSRSAALLALSLFLYQRFVPGTTMRNFEVYFGTRTPAMACAMAAVLFLITDRVRLAAFAAGLAFLVHPIVAVPLGLVLLARLVVLAVGGDLRRSLTGFSVLALTSLPLLCRVFVGGTVDRSGLSLWPELDGAYLAVLRARCGYMFMSNWSMTTVLSFGSSAAVLTGILIYRLRTRRLQRSELRVCEMLLLCLGLVAAAIAFTEWFPSWLIIQLQLYRCFYLIVCLATIYSAHLFLLWAKGIQRLNASRAVEGVLATKHGVTGPSSAARRIAVNRLLATLALGILIGLYLTVIGHAAASFLILVGLAVFQNMEAKPGRRIAFFLVAECLLFGLMVWITVREEGGVEVRDVIVMRGVVAGSVAYGLLSLVVFRNRVQWRPLCIYGTIFATHVGLVCVLSASFEKISLPGVRQQDPLADVGYWCQVHTPKDATIIVPPRSRHFRIYATRGIFGDWKDGGKAVFSKRFAQEWYTRFQLLQDYECITEARCLEIARQYGASHIITLKSRKLRFPLLYQNDFLNVYQIVEDPG